MTYPGAPCIYYGDEIGMSGRKDPDCRRAFPWDESRWNTELRDYVKRCIALRHAHPALRRGDYTRLHTRDEVYAFGRRLKDETMIVVLNNGLHEANVTIDVTKYLAEGTRMTDVWGNTPVTIENGKLPVRMAGRSGTVLRHA
jgi:glycosidase